MVSPKIEAAVLPEFLMLTFRSEGGAGWLGILVVLPILSRIERTPPRGSAYSLLLNVDIFKVRG